MRPHWQEGLSLAAKPMLSSDRTSLWLWRGSWVLCVLLGVALLAVYVWLPADGATGDLESFTEEGLRVQWLLEERQGGLQVGDLIVRAGGYTADEWLGGAPRGPEWRSGGVVAYEVQRAGQLITLQVELAPVPFMAVVVRWALQLVAIAGFLFIGTLILFRRSLEPAPPHLMIVCMVAVLQLWGDAYNIQYAVLPFRWPFLFHLILEQLSFGLIFSAGLQFVLLFPTSHPVMKRYPRLVPLAVYAVFPLVIIITMALATNWSSAIVAGNRISLVLAVLYGALGISVLIRSSRTAADPVARSQVRWILFGIAVWAVIAILGYSLPIVMMSNQLVSHPVISISSAVIPIVIYVVVMRYRLFAIDTIINRTIVYAILTVLLGCVYLLLVRLLAWLAGFVFGRPDDTLVVFISTLSIALAFAPLRRQVQALIDRAFHHTKRRYRDLVAETGELLASRVVPEELTDLLTVHLPQRLQVTSATLAVMDLEGTRLSLFGERPGQLIADHPLVEWLKQSAQPVLRLQPPLGVPLDAQALLEEYGLELVIPLLVGQELVGFYGLGPKVSGDAYSYYEVGWLDKLGQQMAIAVENSRLFQAEQDQRVLAEALQEAASVVGSTLDLEQVLDHILEQVARSVAGDAFNIMLIEGGDARVVRWRGYEKLGNPDAIAHLPLHIGEHPTLTYMTQNRMPVVVLDTTVDPRWVARDGLAWVRSYVSAPIRAAGVPVGFLNVDGARPNQFSVSDAHRLESFANHAAMAIENARLYQQTVHRLGRSQVLREVMIASASTLDLDQVLERTADTLRSTMGVEYLCFGLLNEEGTGLSLHPANIGFGPASEGFTLPIDGSICGHVFKTGSPLIVGDVREVSYYYEGDPQVRSGLAVPVIVDGEVIGVLDVESSHLQGFDRQDLDFYVAIAGQLGITLQNAGLYEEVRQQTLELTEALAALQELDHMKNEFIQNVSHELRLPLALILGYAELLTEGELGDLQTQQRLPLEIIARRARTLSEMVEDITVVFLAGERALEREPVNVCDLVNAAAEDFSVRARQKGLELEIEVSDDLPLIEGGANNLRRVLDNLLGNALKFTPEGGIVRLRAFEQDDRVMMQVSDTGIGIPADQLERVFERFYQVDGSARRKYGGAGLGLALVKDIVEAYGGEVLVDSEVDEGSTFTVALPRV